MNGRRGMSIPRDSVATAWRLRAVDINEESRQNVSGNVECSRRNGECEEEGGHW